MILELENLTVRFGRRTVLDSISLVFQGGSLGLLGPNGAGKSTLLKTLLGFVAPATGCGRVLGYDIRSQALSVRGTIGYLPENDCHIPGMNAFSFVRYAAELAGMKPKEAIERSHEALNYVGVGEARYRALESYSAGMKQRIKLAQALVHDPAVLLLDEPTNGLDPGGRAEMLGIIADLTRSRGVHLVLSSHLLPDVESVCEQVLVLDNGKKIAFGAIAEMKQDGGPAFECRIQGDRRLFMNELEALGCRCDDRELDAGGRGTFSIRVPEGFPTSLLLDVAARHGMQIRHLLPVRQSLEDVFLRFIGGPDARP